MDEDDGAAAPRAPVKDIRSSKATTKTLKSVGVNLAKDVDDIVVHPSEGSTRGQRKKVEELAVGLPLTPRLQSYKNKDEMGKVRYMLKKRFPMDNVVRKSYKLKKNDLNHLE